MKKLLNLLTLTCFLSGAISAQRVVKVTDINPSGYSIASYISEMNGLLFFAAEDGVNHRQLWVSDGTASGTRMLKRINADSSSGIYEFKEYKGYLYFAADNGIHGRELWRTDGTESGTVLFRDIYPNAEGSDPGSFHISRPYLSDSSLFFTANDGTHGRELWQTDGTLAGTRLVQDINPGGGRSSISYLTNYMGNIYFACDSTPPPPGSTDNPELWVCDGFWGICSLLRDINPGPSGSHPRSFTEYKNLLHFTVNAGGSGVNGLWSLDASKTLRMIRTDMAFYGPLTVSGDRLFFRGFTRPDDINNIEPWVSDGTAAGTRRLKDVFPGSNGSGQGQLFPYRGGIVFAADDGVHGIEPWISDGTTAGTRLLKNISAGASSNPSGFIVFEDLLYFWVSNDEGSYDLYRTDGTAENTLPVVTGIPGVSTTLTFVYKNTLYFLANEGELHYVDFQTSSIAETGRVVNPFSVFPNPAGDYVMVSFELKQHSDVTISLTNIEGKVVKGALFIGGRPAGIHQMRLDLPRDISRGTYFVNLATVAEMKW